MAVQAEDGTKLQANATKDRTYDAKGLHRLLERTETVIKIPLECKSGVIYVFLLFLYLIGYFVFISNLASKP